MPILRGLPTSDAPAVMNTNVVVKMNCGRGPRKRTRSMYLDSETRAVAAPLPPPEIFSLPLPSTVDARKADSLGWKMMQKMGYVPGTCLGASTSAPRDYDLYAALASLRGRAGLGHPIYAMGKFSVTDDDNHHQDGEYIFE